MSLHRFLLDTNVLSQIVREPFGTAAEMVLARGIERVCTSILVAAELRYGAAKSDSQRLQARVGQVLTGIDVLHFDHLADQHYAILRQHLIASGQPIGPVDMFIAAHALALGLTLVTANIREFSRVPGLKVENWLD